MEEQLARPGFNWKRWAIRSALSVFAFGVLVSIAIWYWSDDLRQLAIQELNKNLKAQVRVKGGIHLSLLRFFPEAAVSLRQITIDNLPESTGQLLELEELNLVFNLRQLLFDKHIQVNKLELRNGYINAENLPDGQKNWEIWNSKSDTTASSGKQFTMTVKVEETVLKNIQLAYTDYPGSLSFATKIKKLEVEGSFSKQEFRTEIEGDAQISHLVLRNDTLLKNTTARLATEVFINTANGLYRLDKGNLTLEKNKFLIEGFLSETKSGMAYELNFTATETNLAWVAGILPGETKQILNDYKPGGKVNLNIVLKDDKTTKVGITLLSQFEITEGKFYLPQTGLEFQKVSGKGAFQSLPGKNRPSLKIAQASVTSKYGTLTAHDFELTDPADPSKISFFADGIFPLEALNWLVMPENFPLFGEPLTLAAFRYASGLTDIEKNWPKHPPEITGKATSSNLSFEHNKEKVQLKQVEAEFQKNGLVLTVDKLELGKTRLGLQVNAQQYIPWIFSLLPEGPASKMPLHLTMEADISHLETTDLIALFEPSPENGATPDKAHSLNFERLFHIQGKVKFAANSFRHELFNADKIRGTANLSPGRISIPDLQFNGQDGNYDLSGFLKFQPSATEVNLFTTCRQVDIKKLFADTKDFGQTFITSKNLSGKLDTDIQVALFWKDQRFLLDKLTAKAGMKLSGGELKNFEPLLVLSKHISVEELQNVRFSKLENDIEIGNSAILIPEMTILSSIADFKVKGYQTFEGKLDFSVQLFLGSLLAGKFRKKNPKRLEEGEPIGNGGLKLHLAITGDADNLKVEMDRQNWKKNVVEALKETKETSPKPSGKTPEKHWEIKEEPEYIEWDD